MNNDDLSIYDYEFSIWVTQPTRFSISFIELLAMMSVRYTVELSEDLFFVFRHDLLIDGIELKEIERKPHHNPETVL